MYMLFFIPLRTLVNLPHILSLNTGMDNPQDVQFWKNQMNRLYEQHKPAAAEEDQTAAEDGEAETGAETGAKGNFVQNPCGNETSFFFKDSL